MCVLLAVVLNDDPRFPVFRRAGREQRWGDCCYFSASHSRLPLLKAFAPWPQSRGCRCCVVGACCELGRGFELLPQGLLKICPFLKVLVLSHRASCLSGIGKERNRTQDWSQEAMAGQGVSNTTVCFQGLPS